MTPVIPENRKLTASESSFLEWLLENGTPDARSFAPNIEDVRVVSRCSCGCPSLDLEVAGAQEQPSAPSRRIADFLGVTPEGIDVGVMLHTRKGVLSELEVYCFGENDGPFGLPVLETLKPFKPQPRKG